MLYKWTLTMCKYINWYTEGKHSSFHRLADLNMQISVFVYVENLFLTTMVPDVWPEALVILGHGIPPHSGSFQPLSFQIPLEKRFLFLPPHPPPKKKPTKKTTTNNNSNKKQIRGNKMISNLLLKLFWKMKESVQILYKSHT